MNWCDKCFLRPSVYGGLCEGCAETATKEMAPPGTGPTGVLNGEACMCDCDVLLQGTYPVSLEDTEEVDITSLSTEKQYEAWITGDEYPHTGPVYDEKGRKEYGAGYDTGHADGRKEGYEAGVRAAAERVRTGFINCGVGSYERGLIADSLLTGLPHGEAPVPDHKDPWNGLGWGYFVTYPILSNTAPDLPDEPTIVTE